MKSRLLIVLTLLVAWSGVVMARLYDLQVTRHEEYRRRAEKQQLIEVELNAPRGTIYDARGRELAVSVTVESAYAVAPELGTVDQLLRRVEGVPGVHRKRLAQRLAEGDQWVWVARKLDPPAAEELRRRQVPGVAFVRESHRYYPLRDSAGPVLGVVGVDNDGLEGLEARYENQLSGGEVRRTLLRDARRGTLQIPGFSFQDAEPGRDLHLTIDASIQYVVERELRAAVERHRARAATAVLLNPETGAILAMAAVPDFDPNRFTEVDKTVRRNAVILDAFEPGSTFKMVTAAAALEANLVDPVDRFDCEQGAVTVDGVRIRDHKPFGELSFREVIAKSSNVGAVKVGLLVGDRRLSEQIEAFGFGRKTGVDLPGESAGIVHPRQRWGRVGTAYVSFGQSVSVTPLQLASAFAAVANGGRLYRPYVVAEVVGADGSRSVTEPELLRRPIGEATARTLERLLEAVVEQGTGQQAAIPGYRVAGKTGTAQVPVKGGYSADRHVASFVGFVPARRPSVLGLVAIHEPKDRIHGGEVAAPVFASIMRQVLVYLGIPPERADAPWPEPPPAPVPSRVAEIPSAPPVADADALPDLTGLTARQALARSAALGLAPRLNGRGFVERQRPAPGTPLEQAGDQVELWLAGGSR